MNSPIKVVVYDENTEVLLADSALANEMTVTYCIDPLTVFDLVVNSKVDVLLVNDKVQILSCVEFIDKLQSFNISNDIAVAIFSDITDRNYRAMLLDKGVLDVFEIPSNTEQLSFRVRMLLKLAELRQKVQIIGQQSRNAEQSKSIENSANFYGLQQPFPEQQLFPAFEYNLVRAAVELIKSDYAQLNSLDALAQKLSTNERSLTSAFFGVYQCSISAWVREEKLLVARKLVLNGVGNITQIAHELGYADIAHFSRSYKNRFGCSPKKMYRKDNLFPSAEEHDL